MSDSNSSTGGVGFLECLQLLFIALKLLDKIDWSWWWVLLPTVIPLAIVAVLLVMIFIKYLSKGVSDD